jgi:RNA polymerase sigma-70 factor (ECF subfamily)
MALDELFVPYMPQLYRAAARVLRNPQDSEDALQEGLLSAVRHLNQYQGRSKFSTWLHSIVVNAARMKLRRQNLAPTTSIDEEVSGDDGLHSVIIPADSRPNPEEKCAQKERSRILSEMMQDLPPIYQSVIRLCDFEGLLEKEAAERLCVPVGTVKGQLHRGRKLLAKRMRRACAAPNTQFGSPGDSWAVQRSALKRSRRAPSPIYTQAG